ncbi:hypothetical protein GOBAR_DD36677 [Gossypium barbadense]|nr:hypothetical protein GOBAR_DD36677 [Gossypium barbadense]
MERMERTQRELQEQLAKSQQEARDLMVRSREELLEQRDQMAKMMEMMTALVKGKGPMQSPDIVEPPQSRANQDPLYPPRFTPPHAHAMQRGYPQREPTGLEQHPAPSVHLGQGINMTGNPFPNHTGGNVKAVTNEGDWRAKSYVIEVRTPLRKDMMDNNEVKVFDRIEGAEEGEICASDNQSMAFPYSVDRPLDNKAVPWKYDVNIVVLEGEKSKVMNDDVSGVGHFSRSGRCYSPETVEPKKKVAGPSQKGKAPMYEAEDDVETQLEQEVKKAISEDVVECSFRPLEFINAAFVAEGNKIPIPKLSRNTNMGIKLTVGKGARARKGLGKHQQGMVRALKPTHHKGRYEWEPLAYPPLSRTFTSAGVMYPRQDNLQVTLLIEKGLQNISLNAIDNENGEIKNASMIRPCPPGFALNN